MTMPYKVKDAKLLDGIAPGDLINATLVVVDSNDAYLTDVKKVGAAPLEKPPADAHGRVRVVRLRAARSPASRCRTRRSSIRTARSAHFSSFKGRPVVLTFIYTSCPMPTFCPLMDRHFATIQKHDREAIRR